LLIAEQRAVGLIPAWSLAFLHYEIHNKEMLVVVRCLEAWRYFLKGTVVKFEIWTDHKNLEYFMKT